MIYDISYKTLISAKPWRNRFNKVNGFVRVYDGTKYLMLFSLEKYNDIYNSIRYLSELKTGITFVFLTIFEKSKLIQTMICP